MIFRFCRTPLPQNRHILPRLSSHGRIFRLCRMQEQESQRFRNQQDWEIVGCDIASNEKFHVFL